MGHYSVTEEEAISSFTILLHTTLQQAGLDDSQYAAHSFRIGQPLPPKKQAFLMYTLLHFFSFPLGE